MADEPTTNPTTTDMSTEKETAPVAHSDSNPDISKEHDVVSDKAAHMEPDTERNLSIANRSWIYRPFKIGGMDFGWYASPATQLILVAFVCFLCPGMFNAVNGMGAGGQVDPTTSNNANTSLYSCFSVVGFFAGSIVNRLGIKTTLSFAGFGYVLYIASYLSYNYNANEGFVIFAGAMLGICAALLWSAQGAIMMSYPPEGNKGKYIAWFWGIFNLGGVLGSLIPLGQNISNSGGTVTNGTYIGFIVLTALGAFTALTLVNADKVVRRDGSKVILMKHPSWKTEIFGLWEVLLTDYYIVLMFPMFWASNFFYTYQFNDVNLARFTVRTRALNGVLYWGAQIVGAAIFGYSLDSKRVSRKTRARACLIALFVLTMAIWGGGYAAQKEYVRDSRAQSKDPAVLKALEASKMDWTTPGYVGPMFLYIFYGMFDAAWQTSVYWLMGTMSNNSRKLANFAGFYKGIQSAGNAVGAAIDNYYPPYMNEFGGNWGLLVGSLIFVTPVILWKVQESVEVEEDLKFSDETIEDVKASPEIVPS